MRVANIFRQRYSLTPFTALVAICAWLIASNHCTLGAMAQERSGCAHSSCDRCNHQSTPSKNGNGGPLQCCKSLQAALFNNAKAPVSNDGSLFYLKALFLALFSYPDPFGLRLTPLEIDTGPPRLVSFAESVLHRSLPALAPPLV